MLIMCERPVWLPKQLIYAPCNQCFLCKRRRLFEMTRQMQDENSLYGNNATFISLTYSDQNLPPHSSLLLSDYQKFMKLVRWHALKRTKKQPIPLARVLRPCYAGEYDSSGIREWNPHYHIVLFGLSLDKIGWRWKYDGHKWVKISPWIQKLWPHGFTTVDFVTDQNIRYIAKYATKQFTALNPIKWPKLRREKKPLKKREPEYVDPRTAGRIRPFARMCNNLGRQYVLDNLERIRSDKCLTVYSKKQDRSIKIPLPRPYKKWAELKAKDFDHIRYAHSIELMQSYLKETGKVPYELWPKEKRIVRRKYGEWKKRKQHDEIAEDVPFARMFDFPPAPRLEFTDDFIKWHRKIVSCRTDEIRIQVTDEYSRRMARRRAC